MFWREIRKIGIPLQTPVFFYIKVGLKGVYITRTSFPDDPIETNFLNVFINYFKTTIPQISVLSCFPRIVDCGQQVKCIVTSRSAKSLAKS